MTINADQFCIIIGSMKAGTSSLWALLADLPEICPCSNKEPEFFSKREEKDISLKNYSQLWDFDPSIHRYALEASTGYTKWPAFGNVPKRMAKIGIKPKLIYIIRNPFERIRSHLEFMRNVSSDFDCRSMKTLDYAISISNYYQQLQQYKSCFHSDSILLLDFKELKADSTSIVRKITDFLDLKKGKEQKKQLEHFNKTPHRGAVERWVMRSASVRNLASKMPEGLRKGIKSLVKSLDSGDFELSASQKERIRAALSEDMKKLRAGYGIDTTRWDF